MGQLMVSGVVNDGPGPGWFQPFWSVQPSGPYLEGLVVITVYLHPLGVGAAPETF
jgi:hypothetical protein